MGDPSLMSTAVTCMFSLNAYFAFILKKIFAHIFSLFQTMDLTNSK